MYFNFHVKVVHLLANIGYQAMQIFPSKKIISMWHFSAVGTFTGLTNDFDPKQDPERDLGRLKLSCPVLSVCTFHFTALLSRICTFMLEKL